MTQQTENQEQLDNTAFLQEWISSVDPNSGELPDVETAALDFASQIEGREAQLTALGGLVGQVEHKSEELRALIRERQDEKFGSGVPEIKLEDMATLTDRLLQAINPAFVLRAGEYDDFSEDVLGKMFLNNNLTCVRQTRFPTSAMDSASLPDSKLHLDNFIDGPNPGFPYAITASRVTQGSVLFIAGFASKAAQKFSAPAHHSRQDTLNTNRAVERLYQDARLTNHLAPRTVQVDDTSAVLRAVSLHEGDVVVWPQGGPGSETPVWHAVRQLGDPKSSDFTPRESFSYHFTKPAVRSEH